MTSLLELDLDSNKGEVVASAETVKRHPIRKKKEVRFYPIPVEPQIDKTITIPPDVNVYVGRYGVVHLPLPSSLHGGIKYSDNQTRKEEMESNLVESINQKQVPKRCIATDAAKLSEDVDFNDFLDNYSKYKKQGIYPKCARPNQHFNTCQGILPSPTHPVLYPRLQLEITYKHVKLSLFDKICKETNYLITLKDGVLKNILVENTSQLLKRSLQEIGRDKDAAKILSLLSFRLYYSNKNILYEYKSNVNQSDNRKDIINAEGKSMAINYSKDSDGISTTCPIVHPRIQNQSVPLPGIHLEIKYTNANLPLDKICEENTFLTTLKDELLQRFLVESTNQFFSKYTKKRFTDTDSEAFILLFFTLSDSNEECMNKTIFFEYKYTENISDISKDFINMSERNSSEMNSSEYSDIDFNDFLDNYSEFKKRGIYPKCAMPNHMKTTPSQTESPNDITTNENKAPMPPLVNLNCQLGKNKKNKSKIQQLRSNLSSVFQKKESKRAKNHNAE